MSAPARAPEQRRPRGWPRSVALGLALVLVYKANGRVIETFDTVATTALPYAIIRGDGPFLDRFRVLWQSPGEALPPYVEATRGHLVSRYPVAPALVALPLVWAQVAVLDVSRAGWDRTLGGVIVGCRWMGKLAAAIIAALAAVALERVLRGLGLGRVALPATLAAALGSDLFAVASQALWQHGPAALALVLLIGLLSTGSRPVSRPRLLLAGAAAATLVACRALDVVFAAAALLWVARHQPRGLGWFLPAPVLIGGALLAYNLHYFGDPAGGQARLEAMHPGLHGVRGVWSGDPVEGGLGTLFSPNRGLFVFTPWTALALALLPATARRLPPRSPIRWLLAALVPYSLLLSKYTVWWGGHCFGPRYWTDAIPLFAILLAYGLDWARERCRPVLAVCALTFLWSVGVQALGAFAYPSGWNVKPANVDLHHERLWDWRDTELSRCLRAVLAGRRT